MQSNKYIKSHNVLIFKYNRMTNFDKVITLLYSFDISCIFFAIDTRLFTVFTTST